MPAQRASTTQSNPATVTMTGRSRKLLAPLAAGLLLVGATMVLETDATAAETAQFTVPAGIANDCSVDVSAAINSWIAGVPDGSELLFGPNACYRVDFTVNVTDRNNLTIRGQNSTFRNPIVPPMPRYTRPIWRFVGGSNIAIRSMTAEGSNPDHKFDVDREWWAMFRFDGTQGVTLENIHGRNSWGDFVTLSPDTRTSPQAHTSNVILRNSSADIVGRNAVSCTGCYDVVIADNDFEGVGYQVFDIEVEGTNWYARNIAITGNEIGNHHLSVLVNGGIGAYVTGIRFTGNTMRQASETCESPIFVLDGPGDKSNFTVSDNVLMSHSPIFRVNGLEGLVATNNIGTFVAGVQCQYQFAAIRAKNTSGTVQGNDFALYPKLVQVEGPVMQIRGVACGNRLKDDALFDEPVAC